MQRVEKLNWPALRIRHIPPVYFFIAALSSLPLIALMSTTPMSWWKQSGFETYPGTFVAVGTDTYPLCRPWRGKAPGAYAPQGTRVTARFGTIEGGREANFAVLLPKDARITGIYCGTAEAPARPAECSVSNCPWPAHAQVEDGLYTLGRGVEMSFRARAAKPGARTNIGFWVLWRQDKAG